MRRAKGIIGAIAVVAQVASAGEANPISRLIAFPEAKQVRIECRISPSEDAGPVEATASIVHDVSGQVLWSGGLGSISRDAERTVVLNNTVLRLTPELWEPSRPNLYKLVVSLRKNENELGKAATRIGFRTMTITNGQFRLNGRPVFLRGIAINPPGRTIPSEVGESREFAEAYVRFLKSQNVNIFRISKDTSPVWFDVCDELGMMLYAGRYGWPFGAADLRKPPSDFEKSMEDYRALFEDFANHPSIVMYYLANELPTSGARGAAFSKYLAQAYAVLKEWDPTRPFIANAGYGEGREGDVCDVHRYWGWYYNSFLTYYNLRDSLVSEPLFGDGKNQPLTFTECVGSFTGSSGEFNVVRSKQLAPRLGWIGNTEAPVEDSLAYQSRVLKEATESFRRMRPMNHRLAGIMPFTILFYNWSGIKSFADMEPKQSMDQLRISYQPVLLSWELWTPQVYAGARLRPMAHVINDDESGHALTNAVLKYAVRGKDKGVLLEGNVDLPTVPHFGTWSTKLDMTLPTELLTGEFLLTGSIEQNGIPISTNWSELFVAEHAWGHPPVEPTSAVHIYDWSSRSARALAMSGIKATVLKEIPNPMKRVQTLVIGENAWDEHLTKNRNVLRQFVLDGGRIVCLQQQNAKFPLDWLPSKIVMLQGSATDPVYPPATRPHKEQSHLNMERPSHPVFIGLDRKRLALWSDYTGWDQTQKGFPRLFPITSGFRLVDPEDLKRTAVLADYDRGLEGVALCEMFEGKGSVILSGLDLVNRAGVDPASDRLLANIILYAAAAEGHDPLPTPSPELPINWGNLVTEQGVCCGSLNGLVVNAEWQRGRTQENEKPLPANSGAWNMMPGDQFVPKGRNPFGSYTYATGATLIRKNKDTIGEGFFYARSPGGVMRIRTTARNPGAQPATFRMTLNGKTAGTTILPGQTGSVALDLPWETELRVGFSGPTDLVLEETRFE